MLKKLWKNLSHNWMSKLISLTAAILLWFYVYQQRQPERYLVIPLHIQNLPKEMTVSAPYNNLISIRVKAPESIIQTLAPRYFLAYVDAKDVIIGENRLPVFVKKLIKRRGVKITHIDPRYVIITIDKLVRKSVPVSPTIVNSPAPGYTKTGEIFYPEKVVLEGPESILKEIEVARTKPIDIGGLTGSVYKEVELDLESEFVKPVTYRKIKVNVIITKSIVTREFRHIKVNVKNLHSKFKIKNISSLYANVVISGPSGKFDKLIDKINSMLYIDTKDIKEEGSYKKKVKAFLGGEFKVVKIQPEKIKIIVERR